MQEKYPGREHSPRYHEVRLNKNAYINYRFMTVEHNLVWDYGGFVDNKSKPFSKPVAFHNSFGVPNNVSLQINLISIASGFIF